MVTQLIKEIEEDLITVISKKRFIHTMGVVESSRELAIRYNENVEHATISALLHDYAKGFKKAELMKYIEAANIELDEVLMNAHELLHGKVASLIAKEKFKILEHNILNAIEYHTTGRANMSKLEKIIYLADFIEPGRVYEGVDELRKIAKVSLDKAVFKALNNTIAYVIAIQKPLHPNTIYARNHFLIKDYNHIKKE